MTYTEFSSVSRRGLSCFVKNTQGSRSLGPLLGRSFGRDTPFTMDWTLEAPIRLLSTAERRYAIDILARSSAFFGACRTTRFGVQGDARLRKSTSLSPRPSLWRWTPSWYQTGTGVSLSTTTLKPLRTLHHPGISHADISRPLPANSTFNHFQQRFAPQPSKPPEPFFFCFLQDTASKGHPNSPSELKLKRVDLQRA